MHALLENPAETFWAVMIFASIGWYFFLLFYVGARGGWEVLRLGHSSEEKSELPPPPK